MTRRKTVGRLGEVDTTIIQTRVFALLTSNEGMGGREYVGCFVWNTENTVRLVTYHSISINSYRRGETGGNEECSFCVRWWY